MSRPLFETISYRELGRLLLIVVSSASIAWAGQLAHSSEEPRVVSIAEFASSEISRADELYSALTERAELLPVGPQPSDARIKDSLKGIEESLLLSRHALQKFKASGSPRSRAFNEENLKSQIFRLQEATRDAQGLFIARESAQSFSVSRTGQ